MTVHEEYQSLTLRDINRRYSWDEEEEAATNVTISEYREIIMKEDQVDENHANLLKQDRRDTFNRKQKCLEETVVLVEKSLSELVVLIKARDENLAELRKDMELVSNGMKVQSNEIVGQVEKIVDKRGELAKNYMVAWTNFVSAKKSVEKVANPTASEAFPTQAGEAESASTLSSDGDSLQMNADGGQQTNLTRPSTNVELTGYTDINRDFAEQVYVPRPEEPVSRINFQNLDTISIQDLKISFNDISQRDESNEMRRAEEAGFDSPKPQNNQNILESLPKKRKIRTVVYGCNEILSPVYRRMPVPADQIQPSPENDAKGLSTLPELKQTPSASVNVAPASMKQVALCEQTRQIIQIVDGSSSAIHLEDKQRPINLVHDDKKRVKLDDKIRNSTYEDIGFHQDFAHKKCLPHRPGLQNIKQSSSSIGNATQAPSDYSGFGNVTESSGAKVIPAQTGEAESAPTLSSVGASLQMNAGGGQQPYLIRPHTSSEVVKKPQNDQSVPKSLPKKRKIRTVVYGCNEIISPVYRPMPVPADQIQPRPENDAKGLSTLPELKQPFSASVNVAPTSMKQVALCEQTRQSTIGVIQIADGLSSATPLEDEERPINLTHDYKKRVKFDDKIRDSIYEDIGFHLGFSCDQFPLHRPWLSDTKQSSSAINNAAPAAIDSSVQVQHSNVEKNPRVDSLRLLKKQVSEKVAKSAGSKAKSAPTLSSDGASLQMQAGGGQQTNLTRPHTSSNVDLTGYTDIDRDFAEQVYVPRPEEPVSRINFQNLDTSSLQDLKISFNDSNESDESDKMRRAEEVGTMPQNDQSVLKNLSKERKIRTVVHGCNEILSPVYRRMPVPADQIQPRPENDAKGLSTLPKLKQPFFASVNAVPAPEPTAEPLQRVKNQARGKTRVLDEERPEAYRAFVADLEGDDQERNDQTALIQSENAAPSIINQSKSSMVPGRQASRDIFEQEREASYLQFISDNYYIVQTHNNQSNDQTSLIQSQNAAPSIIKKSSMVPARPENAGSRALSCHDRGHTKLASVQAFRNLLNEKRQATTDIEGDGQEHNDQTTLIQPQNAASSIINQSKSTMVPARPENAGSRATRGHDRDPIRQASVQASREIFDQECQASYLRFISDMEYNVQTHNNQSNARTSLSMTLRHSKVATNDRDYGSGKQTPAKTRCHRPIDEEAIEAAIRKSLARGGKNKAKKKHSKFK